MPCNELVELVTDYLDGALPPQRRAEVDAHPAICGGCRAVLAPVAPGRRLGGRLAEAELEEVDPAVRAGLMAAFRDSRSPSPHPERGPRRRR